MNVSLTPELEAFIRAKLASGSYHDADEVVREALTLMQQDEERLARLRNAIAEGEKDIREGRLVTIRDEEELSAFFADL